MSFAAISPLLTRMEPSSETKTFSTPEKVWIVSELALSVLVVTIGVLALHQIFGINTMVNAQAAYALIGAGAGAGILDVVMLLVRLNCHTQKIASLSQRLSELETSLEEKKGWVSGATLQVANTRIGQLQKDKDALTKEVENARSQPQSHPIIYAEDYQGISGLIPIFPYSHNGVQSSQEQNQPDALQAEKIGELEAKIRAYETQVQTRGSLETQIQQARSALNQLEEGIENLRVSKQSIKSETEEAEASKIKLLEERQNLHSEILKLRQEHQQLERAFVKQEDPKDTVPSNAHSSNSTSPQPTLTPPPPPPRTVNAKAAPSASISKTLPHLPQIAATKANLNDEIRKGFKFKNKDTTQNQNTQQIPPSSYLNQAMVDQVIQQQQGQTTNLAGSVTWTDSADLTATITAIPVEPPSVIPPAPTLKPNQTDEMKKRLENGLMRSNANGALAGFYNYLTNKEETLENAIKNAAITSSMVIQDAISAGMKEKIMMDSHLLDIKREVKLNDIPKSSERLL